MRAVSNRTNFDHGRAHGRHYGHRKAGVFDLTCVAQGQGVIDHLCIHFLDEVMDLRSRYVMTGRQKGRHSIVSELSKQRSFREMVGRDVEALNIQRPQAPSDIVMSVRGLSVKNILHNINLTFGAEKLSNCVVFLGWQNRTCEALFGIASCERGAFISMDEKRAFAIQ